MAAVRSSLLLKGRLEHAKALLLLQQLGVSVTAKSNKDQPRWISISSCSPYGVRDETFRHQDSFEFIATSMRKCLNHLGPWSIGDLAFGMKVLSEMHTELADNIDGKPITDLQLLRNLHEEVCIADAIYERTTDEVVELCSLEKQHIVRFLADADRMRPAYCIALRPERKEVLLIVRGTKSLGDAITILTGSGAEFQGGHTHAGMLASAKWLLHHETSHLAKLLTDNPGFRLHFVGHSLGAGAAALYAMLLRERAAKGENPLPNSIQPSCLAIAAPACMTQDLATSCSDYMTSLVCQDDIVPRACLWAFEQLRQEVVKTNWQDEVADKFIADGLREFASSTSSLVAEQYKVVAKLLTGKDRRTAKVVSVLAEAWDSLAENTSKHSDSALELLSKTSFRVARLPSNSARKAVAAINTSSKLQDLKEKLSSSAKLQDLKEKVQQLYTQSEAPGVPKTDAKLSASNAEHSQQPGRESAQSRPEVSLAADDQWESSAIITGRHEIEPPSDDTLEDRAAGRKALFSRMGKDVDRIAHSYGIRQSERSNKQQVRDNADHEGDVIALASDGDVDAELASFLSDLDEAEAAEKDAFLPAPRMFPPGKLIYLKRISGEGKGADYEALLGHEGQSFGRIILAKTMITDHLCATYMAALQNVIQKL